ncbi:MAG: hypothetical protein JWR23_885 [Mucilaginibacter sp.]|nr:hypothetical protein [Mucilaginibacter sp.]
MGLNGLEHYEAFLEACTNITDWICLFHHIEIANLQLFDHQELNTYHP